MSDSEGLSEQEIRDLGTEVASEIMEEARENARNDDSDPADVALIADGEADAENLSGEREYAVRHDFDAMADAETNEDGGLLVENGDSVTVGEPRDMQGYSGVCLQTYKLLEANAARDYQKQHRILRRMERAGWYEGREGTTGSQGQPFLPVQVADRIDAIRDEVGIMRDLVTVFNLDEGSVKMPGVQGKVPVDAVNENSKIPGKGFTTEKVELDPSKYGAIHPFTTELREEVGAQYVDNLVEAVGIGFAEAEDQTVLTADGTASFHGITGLLNDSNINEFILGGSSTSGNTGFRDLSYDDWLKAHEEVDPALYENLVSVYHPFLQFVYRRFQPASNLLYPTTEDLPESLEFTEALPGPQSNASGTSFGVVGDFSYVHMAIQREITADMLTEGIVDNSNGNDVNLAQQDAVAMRFTAKWDVDRNALSDSAFTKLTTASS
jgi:hypothetical protein